MLGSGAPSAVPLVERVWAEQTAARFCSAAASVAAEPVAVGDR